MWQIKRIEIVDLMTHVDTCYDFVAGECVMIYGENQTDEGADSNGSGKSVILEAITLAITGEVSREIERDDFINDEAEQTNVRLFLENKKGTINSLLIDRTIHRTKSQKIVLTENGEINKEMTSVNESNARIYELIQLNKFDLMNFFLIGQEKKFSFLTCSDVDKKDIISRFSNVDFINQKIEDLKLKSKLELENFRKYEIEIGKLDSKIEIIDEQIESFKKNNKNDSAEKIQKLNDKINSALSEIDTEKTKIDKLKTREKEIEKLSTKKDKLSSDLEKVNEKISSLNDKQKKLQKSISDNEELAIHLQAILDGLVECPKCSHNFSLSDEMDISEIPDYLKNLDLVKKENQSDLEQLGKKIKNLKSDKQKIVDGLSDIEDLKTEQARNAKNQKESKLEIKELEENIEKYRNQINTLKTEKKDNSELNQKKEKKKEIKLQKSSIESNLLSSKSLIEDYEFWIHHFGKKGFMTFLTNKSIKSIEGITNNYLKKVNTDLQVEISGYTVLKSGSLSDKIGISIVRNGKKLAKFARYSGGEKGRIVIANILGLQKLINMSCSNGGLGFLGLDEVFEGLDVTGQIEVTKILEELGMTSLVISHGSKAIGAKNELTIKKVNGISYILK